MFQPLRLRGAGLGMIAGALLALLFFSLYVGGYIDPIEWMTLDMRFVARFAGVLGMGADTAHVPVTVVVADERAVEAFGRWPWPRNIQAQVFEEILKDRPAVLGIDVVYSDAEPRHDPHLAAVLDGDIPVVLAAAVHDGGLLYPRIELLSTRTHVAHTVFATDGDGITRRLPFRQLTELGTLLPFGWEVASRGAAEMNRRGIAHVPLVAPPLDEAGQFLINYRRRGPGRMRKEALAETVSVIDIIDGAARDVIEGRIVLFGPETLEETGRGGRLTPLRPLGSLPEVYVHAAIISSLFDGAHLELASARSAAWGSVAFAAVAGALAFVLAPWLAALAVGGVLLAVTVFSLALFQWSNTWVPWTPTALALVTTYVAGVWYRHRSMETDTRRLRATFERYVSSEVAEALLAEPHLAEARGGRRPVTILFADIRGFTAYAEGRSPEEVVHTLNRYFALMAEAVHAGSGMVDKFLGDGMMAVFGAPLPQEGHAEKGVVAAMRMLEAVESAGLDLPIGVGIHSGEAVVGSLGSWKRQEYTAVGDNVNIAARLQEHAEPGQLLISHETFSHLPRQLASEFAPLPPLKVRGRSQPIAVHHLTDA